MDPVQRISSLVTAIVAAGIWYVVCLIAAIGIFRRVDGNIAFYITWVLFFIGFIIAAARRKKLVGSAKQAQRQADNLTSNAEYGRETASIDAFRIASFLPDLAIGAFRAFLGLEEDEVGFN